MDYTKVLDSFFSQFAGGRFGIRYWTNEVFHYGSGDRDLFTLHIKRPQVVKRLLTEGALGFGESYMQGDLDIEGDIASYLKLRHQHRHFTPSVRLVLARFWAELTKPRRRDAQIAHHYDRGDDFFALFLDNETMSYSAANFISDDDTLAMAQNTKLKLVCDWMNLPMGSRVLDLGSGWGGFAVYAAKECAWHVDGSTLSHKQLAYSEELVAQKNLSALVAIRYEDFTVLQRDKKYQGAVMIEALEHVGKGTLVSFLSSLSQCLESDAPLYLQYTGRYKPKPVDAWTLKYVFPGGYLPAEHELLDAALATGFKIERFEDHTEDYCKTMTAWISALESSQEHIERRFDEQTFRMWKLWMYGALVNFEIGDMSLFRVLLRKV